MQSPLIVTMELSLYPLADPGAEVLEAPIEVKVVHLSGCGDETFPYGIVSSMSVVLHATAPAPHVVRALAL